MKVVQGNRIPLFILLVLLAPYSSSWAEDVSNQPYIDYLKQNTIENRSEPSGNEPSYTEQIQKDIGGPGTRQVPSYSESLKATELKESRPAEVDPSESYTEKMKSQLEPKDEPSTIEAVKSGKSELELKTPGKIHHAFGLRYGASLNRTMSVRSDVAGGNFDQIYGGNYVPDVSFFYELQPFHSEWFGNIGIFGMGGVSYFHGFGQFAFSLPVAGTSDTFSQQSQTPLQFFALPLTVGLDYRFNLFRILRPYIMAGPTLIGFFEVNTDKSNYGVRRAMSGAWFISVGTAITLDWISRKDFWNSYQNYKIQHIYLTIDYSRLQTFSGSINWLVSGFTAGLAFEY